MTAVPYENQLLGAFILALGQESGRQGTAPSLNLFQQTPLDQRFGDLVAGSQWCMAIEFKRLRSGLSSEKAKWKQALNSHEPEALLQWARSATRGHWICYGVADGGEIALLAEPYLSTFKAQPAVAPIPASDLIQTLASRPGDGQRSAYGITAKHLEHYLAALHRLRNSASGDGPSASWLCAFATGDAYRFLVAASLPELLERTCSLPQHQAERAMRGKAEPERDIEQER
ncbi:hypothetical protein [Stenotrophomonas sp.]|uniref:hypothetical protein n=1 Tax=Stenotrophomonas sp. TaxID=69392 RepID=UPI0028AD66D9|nr:hypothetical protein [Stenotrophomonas sp.]